MSIDLESELRFMANEYGLTEKQVLNWWRTAVRQMWGNSPFKRKLEDEAKYEIVNTNPKSMKRFPIVDRIDCVKCGKAFSPSNMNLDHIKGDNKAESLADAEKFFKSIMFTPRSNLQWLCDDLQATRNKKKYTTSIGCHSVKSQMESNASLSEVEAYVVREVARVKRYENLLDSLLKYNVNLSDIPKTKKAQEELLYNIMMEKFNNDTE